jgi:predicted component of type VI protein secretion system
MPTLMIQLPGLPPVAHVLKDETITVGRMKGNTIVIEDESVSLSHARLTRKHGEYFLKDLNSTNGTVVNGQPILEVKLNDLDRVRFADIHGQFLAEAATAITPSPAGATVNPLALASSASAPTPAPAPATPPKPSPRLAPAFNFARLIGYAGGLAALAVVSFVGWKLLHANQPPVMEQTITVVPAQTVPATPSDTSPTPENVPAADPPTATTESLDDRVARWIKALHGDDATERRHAATALHSLGTEAKAAIPALREALWGSDEEVRQWAALTLIKNEDYDPATIPILVRVLQNENPVLRQVACLSLGIFPFEPAQKEIVVPALTETATKDSDAEVRNAALSALNIIAPAPSPQTGKK